ncbi:hypothetical protein D3C72_2552700 [compost metagenome]
MDAALACVAGNPTNNIDRLRDNRIARRIDLRLNNEISPLSDIFYIILLLDGTLSFSRKHK